MRSFEPWIHKDHPTSFSWGRLIQLSNCSRSVWFAPWNTPVISMGGDVSIASQKSGTCPNPNPENGTQTLVLRKKQDAGTEVPGEFSRCHRGPGSGELATQFAPLASMSSKNFTAPPDAVILTSSMVQPVNRLFESARETEKSEPNRNISWIGCGRVVQPFGMGTVAETQLVPRSPEYEARVSQVPDVAPSWISTHAQS